METWQTLLVALGGNAALLAVLGVLGRSLIDKYIQKDMKQFETELKSKSDFAIQALANELKIKTVEHEIQFSSLHAKRAEVIEKLYKLLVEAIWAVEDFLSPMEWAGDPPKNEKYSKAMTALGELFRFFDVNRIYLPDSLCDAFLAQIEALRKHAIHFGVYLRYDESNGTPETLEKKYNALMEGWNAIKADIPITRKAIEDEFRRLLGSSPNQPMHSDDAATRHRR